MRRVSGDQKHTPWYLIKLQQDYHTGTAAVLCLMCMPGKGTGADNHPGPQASPLIVTQDASPGMLGRDSTHACKNTHTRPKVCPAPIITQDPRPGHTSSACGCTHPHRGPTCSCLLGRVLPEAASVAVRYLSWLGERSTHASRCPRDIWTGRVLQNPEEVSNED